MRNESWKAGGATLNTLGVGCTEAIHCSGFLDTLTEAIVMVAYVFGMTTIIRDAA
jgi:hypothetical protein